MDFEHLDTCADCGNDLTTTEQHDNIDICNKCCEKRDKEEQTITEYLTSNHRFTPLSKKRVSENIIDLDHFTCILKLHIVHYLYYSEKHKAFTIAVKYDQPKGRAGGGYDTEKRIMIPTVIDTIERARDFLKGFIQ